MLSNFGFTSISRTARRLLIAGMIALSFTAVNAQAGVLLDTFAPGDTAPGTDWALYNFGGIGQSLAVSFTTASTVTVDSILAAISGTGNVTFGIMSAATGLPSNTFLYSTVLTDPLANVSLTGLNWVLGTGDYWLAAVGQDSFSGVWTGGTITGPGFSFTNPSITNWLPDNFSAHAAARITTAVPEPETYAMMLAGLGLLGVFARRRKQKLSA